MRPIPSTRARCIEYSLPAAGPVRLVVLDAQGRRVCTLVDDLQSAGIHAVRWDGRDQAGNRLASGVYLYRLEAGSLTATRKMLLLK